MSVHCSPAQPVPAYFVVMIDYGRSREAIVDPEMTRRDVIARILSGEYDVGTISFIHHVTEDGVEDLTSCIIAEATRHIQHHVEANTPYDRMMAAVDHARDLRKHEVA